MKKIKMRLKNQEKFLKHEKKKFLNVFRGKSCNENSSVQCKQGLVGYWSISKWHLRWKHNHTFCRAKFRLLCTKAIVYKQKRCFNQNSLENFVITVVNTLNLLSFSFYLSRFKELSLISKDLERELWRRYFFFLCNCSVFFF